MAFSLPVRELILVVGLLLATVGAAVAEAQGPEPSTSPVLSEVEGSGQVPSTGSGQGLSYDEGEAQAIDRMLMCPVCPAVTIDQTQVELARQMQRVVREMLAQGASRQQVLDFFVERYGPGVLAVPPKGGFSLLAWILPPVGVLAAVGALFLVLRAMVGHPRQEEGEIPPTPLYQRGTRGDLSVAGELPLVEDLAPYLEVIDRELARPDPAKGRSPRQGDNDTDG